MTIVRSGARAQSLAIASVVFGFAGCMSDMTGSATSNAGNDDDGSSNGTSSPLAVINLASDQAGAAQNLGPALENAWGIVAFDGMFWVANEGSGKVSIFDGAGTPATGKVASGAIDLGEGITGVAINELDDKTTFPMHEGEVCQPARLIFASTHGQLIGVNPDLSTTGGFVLVDRSADEAVYLGVAVLHKEHSSLVLAADFHNARIDVFDASFSLVSDVSFVVPDLPRGFAPFNVMVFNDFVYVTYAQPDPATGEELTGPGLGFLATFDASGKLLGTMKSELFNAPWGMARAGSTGPFPNAFLVGNFGDGRITAIDPIEMKVFGQLMGSAGPLAIDGLWGITFGDGVTNARPDGLYFAAGPDDEEHGLFGVIAPPAR